MYDLCKHCDHFVDQNYTSNTAQTTADYIHNCDEQHHNPDNYHTAEPRGNPQPLHWWKQNRPDLFTLYPDQLIGPNSRYYKTKLPKPPTWEKS